MQESIQNLAVNGVTRATSILIPGDESGLVDRVADILLALSDQSEDLRAKIALEQAVRSLRSLPILSDVQKQLEDEYERGYDDGWGDATERKD